jgi:hypothetical protein
MRIVSCFPNHNDLVDRYVASLAICVAQKEHSAFDLIMSPRKLADPPQ